MRLASDHEVEFEFQRKKFHPIFKGGFFFFWGGVATVYLVA